MKEIIAKEFIFLFIALIVALPVGFLFLSMIGIDPMKEILNEEERIIEMDLFLIGCFLGFIGVYISRLTVWAVQKIVVK